MVEGRESSHNITPCLRLSPPDSFFIAVSVEGGGVPLKGEDKKEEGVHLEGIKDVVPHSSPARH
jgi:hypothetical protein